mmetsp:Transcript_30176/g.76332  ORF Transcript_30176/g.76332 Transcript_30176/m.76332 type:complete len:430 (+) Transcript_30176:113-1402(+)
MRFFALILAFPLVSSRTLRHLGGGRVGLRHSAAGPPDAGFFEDGGGAETGEDSITLVAAPAPAPAEAAPELPKSLPPPGIKQKQQSRPLGVVHGAPGPESRSLAHQVPWAVNIIKQAVRTASWVKDRAIDVGNVVAKAGDMAVDIAEKETERRLARPVPTGTVTPVGAAMKKEQEENDGECNPHCGWHCGPSPVCNQVCEPFCAPPECRTLCGRSPETCETRCGAPQCAVICPEVQRGCERGGEDCPKCRTVCSPPVCTTQCGDDCRNVCAKPQCSWKCHKVACPKPSCRMECSGFASCATNFRADVHAPEHAAPFPDEDIVGVTHGMASLDPSTLMKNATPPPTWDQVFVKSYSLDPMVKAVPSTPSPIQAPDAPSSGKWPFLPAALSRAPPSASNPAGLARLRRPPGYGSSNNDSTSVVGVAVVSPS